MIAATSLQAYRTLDPARMARVRDRVLLTVARARMPSNADIERLAGIRLSSVCARINELKADGMVEAGGVKTDPFTRKSVQWWRITDSGRRALEAMA